MTRMAKQRSRQEKLRESQEAAEAHMRRLKAAQMLGERIRFYRDKAGLTQDQVADLVGVQKVRVCQWERQWAQGNTSVLSMELDNFVTLCAVLKVSMVDMWRGIKL